MEDPSRVGTPAAMDEKTGALAEGAASNEAKEEAKENGVEKPVEAISQPVELPADVRTKLRKLEKLESRYQGTAHIFVWWSPANL